MPGRPYDDETKDFARRVWGSLPIMERSFSKVQQECAKLGRPVGRTSIVRWVKEWDGTTPTPRPPRPPVEVIEMGEPIVPPGMATGIDRAIEAVIDPRLNPLLRFDHIKKVEDFLVDVAEAIHDQRSKIAEMMTDPNAESETSETVEGVETIKKLRKGQVARDAVVALVQIANGLKALMDTRAVYAGNYRFIGEYEMFSGKGRLDRAEATKIDEGERANRARQIDGSSDEKTDVGTDALAILRGLATKPK